MRLLVPVDGSQHSMEGVNVALDYAKMKDVEIYLLTVVPPLGDITDDFTLSQGDVVKSSLMQNANETNEKAKAVFMANNIIPRCIVKNTVNTVADEICDVAENEDIDLIIIGSHGLRGLSRFLMGSVASKVVKHSPCSVYVVKM